MAKSNTAPKTDSRDAGEAAAPEAAPARKGRGVLIAVIAVLALLLVGGGAWFFLAGRHAPEAETAAKADKKGDGKDSKDGKDKKAASKDPAKPSVFVSLEPFTVNLRPGQDGERYLQLGLVYEVTGADVSDAIKSTLPVIRSRILLTLTSKTAADLQTLEGKNALSAELLAIARDAAPGAAADKGIGAAHFSAFVIQ